MVASRCWGAYPTLCEGKPPTASVAQQLAEAILKDLQHGAAVTRPLIQMYNEATNLEYVGPSVIRGGNTFIFDLEALRDVSNSAPVLNGRPTRRSDMIWSIMNQKRFSRQIVRAPHVAVYHRRNTGSMSSVAISPDVLRDDIVGHALYCALQAALQTSFASVELTAGMKEVFLTTFKEKLTARSLAGQLNIARIHGLLESLVELLAPATTIPPHSSRPPAISASCATSTSMCASIESIRSNFNIAVLWPNRDVLDLARNVLEYPLLAEKPKDGELLAWLESILQTEAWAPVSEDCRHITDRFRTAACLRLSQKHLPTDLQLTRIGIGGEGVTYCAAAQSTGLYSCIKVMDVFALRTRPGATSNLLQLSSGWQSQPSILTGAAHLPHRRPLLRLECVGEVHAVVPVLQREYVQGMCYAGGMGAAMVTFLRYMRAGNVCCNNISPENLLVEDSTSIVLVDYGIDIVPYTDELFRCMALRAYLCFRWAATCNTAELKGLLSKARDIDLSTDVEECIPEAAGFEYFEEAIACHSGDIEAKLCNALVQAVHRQWPMYSGSSPRSILDFGCGPGRALNQLVAASERIEPTFFGYDTDTALEEKWLGTAAVHNISYTNSFEQVENTAQTLGGFSAVVCCRVLCVVEPGSPEEINLMQRLRRVTAGDGTLYMALCHPVATQCTCTSLQRRVLPEAAALGRPTMIHKVHGCSKHGGQRIDYHRPMHTILRLLRQHHFNPIAQQVLCYSVDLQSFSQPVPEVLLLACKPMVPLYRTLIRTSILGKGTGEAEGSIALLIKTCAMEWRTIATRVRHLVSSLEKPYVFPSGVFLVLDTKSDSFVRQHDDGCTLEVLEGVAKELKAQHWITDYIMPPSDAGSGVITRWFGPTTAFSTATHATNGSPLVSTLCAFEELQRRGVEIALQVDSDLLTNRTEHIYASATGACVESWMAADGVGVEARDFLQPVINFFQDHEHALTLSLPICPEQQGPRKSIYTACRPSSTAFTPWRVEVRGCFLHLPRLLAARPLREAASASPDSMLVIPSWYRSLDAHIALTLPACSSYRGGDGSALHFVHPQNDWKKDHTTYAYAVDIIESGIGVPLAQAGCVDAVSGLRTWLRPSAGNLSGGKLAEKSSWLRAEDYIFIVSLADASPGEMHACLQSIVHQKCPAGTTVGIVIMVDHCEAPASSEADITDYIDTTGRYDHGLYLRHIVHGGGIPGLQGRCTLLMPRIRQGKASMIMTAAKHICINPASVLVVLQHSDQLIGKQVVQAVREAFCILGADVLSTNVLHSDGYFSRSETSASDNRCATSRDASEVFAARKVFFDSIRHIDHPLTSATAFWDWSDQLLDQAWKVATATRPLLFQKAVPERPNIHTLRVRLHAKRIPKVAVVGDASYRRLSQEMQSLVRTTAKELGAELRVNGFHVITGGLAGVMESAADGACQVTNPCPDLASSAWCSSTSPLGTANITLSCTVEHLSELQVIGILPSDDPAYGANAGTTITIATGMGHARNALVATAADALIVVGGGSGTLSEAAMAWSNGRLIIAMTGTGGTADTIACKPLDARRRLHGLAAMHIENTVHAASTPEEAIGILHKCIHHHRLEMLHKEDQPGKW
jgi:uncharacterized protein (TIGR00725 family)